MSRRLPVLPLLLLPLLPSACAEGPFVASTVAEQRQGEVVICYNKNDATPEDIIALARQTCDKYRLPPPEFAGQRGFSCRLTTPAEVVYRCGSAAAAPAEQPEERAPLFERDTSYR